MNSRVLLSEPHNFKTGDSISMYERKYPKYKYNGKIYIIIKKIENNMNMFMPIDYFYITLEKEIYNKILLRGWKIIYRGQEKVIGNIEKNINGIITKIHTQHMFDAYNETEIDIENIDAILIWRVAYNICTVS